MLDTVKSIATPESSSLASISELLAAGFSSRHEAIVNDLIGVWNQTFGKTAALDYPAPLHRALTRFHSRGDIELPTFVNDEQTEVRKRANHS